MNCFICNSIMEFYFIKDFNFYPQFNIGKVEYVKCKNCGLVVSKTHFEMDHEMWKELNNCYHKSYLMTNINTDDPKWLPRLNKQAEVINKLAVLGLIPKDKDWLDYACGDGKLVNSIKMYGYNNIFKYDRYMNNDNNDYLSDKALIKTKYSLVINTSVFEHIRSLEDLDKIVDNVDKNGVLALHTMVKEEISKDPSWHYLLPIHCTFYTNKSMKLLFNRWGFEFSIYHPNSTMWFLYKKKDVNIENILDNENKKNSVEFYYKDGFLDYWKI